MESPLVDVISFTGSNEVGQAIMAAAAPTMKKLSLELGGKNCCVVLEDADIARIAPRLASAAIIISGQQCTAARRILVHESRFEEAKASLSSALAGVKIGNGLEPGTEMGPLITSSARDRVKQRIEQAFDTADEVVLRHAVPDEAPDGSAFLTPSLLAHRDPKADFCQEEIFGPMLVVEPFADEGGGGRQGQRYGLRTFRIRLGQTAGTPPGGSRGRFATAPSGSTITTSSSLRRRPADTGAPASGGCTASTRFSISAN